MKHTKLHISFQTLVTWFEVESKNVIGYKSNNLEKKEDEEKETIDEVYWAKCWS